MCMEGRQPDLKLVKQSLCQCILLSVWRPCRRVEILLTRTPKVVFFVFFKPHHGWSKDVSYELVYVRVLSSNW